MCQAAFDIAIDGFSKVKKCSNQGRASMSLDISVLQTKLNNIHPCRPGRGKEYIDDYIRASYLPEEAMLNWVKENYQLYCYRHIHGLLTQTLNSMLSKKKLNDGIALLDSLYEYPEVPSVQSENSLSRMLKFKGKS